MTGHAWSRPRPAPHDHRRGETSRLGLCIAMSELGQNAKYSARADVFRSSPKNGRWFSIRQNITRIECYEILSTHKLIRFLLLPVRERIALMLKIIAWGLRAVSAACRRCAAQAFSWCADERHPISVAELLQNIAPFALIFCSGLWLLHSSAFI